ncbi:hypothetical protein QZH41_019140 [Actinostola sp. cb2023]|nr:hypothetical protein QZH41_019140 [Actinostola sp. cb2023]
MGLQDFPPGNMGEIRPANERTSLINVGEYPSRKETWPVICIILALLLERTAYYGILANLALFLKELGFPIDVTVVYVFVFSGMAWMMSTVGGLIGDSYSGRFHAIWGSLVVYIIGAALLEVTANLATFLYTSDEIRGLVVALTFIFLSIGEGGFKANVSAFGAEQLLNHDGETYRRFFGWFYWSVNIGSFIGFSLIAWVQVQYNFKIGYSLPLGCLVCSIIIFLIPTSKYTVNPLTGNVVTKVYGIVKEAIVLRKANRRSSTCPGLEEVMPIRSWLDRAMCKYGGSYLDSEVLEVKTLGRISVMFLMLIPYWMIYYQMNSTFLLQGLHMNLRFNTTFKDTTFTVPAAWLSLADVTVVLLLIPLMDRVIYPWLDKKGYNLSLNKRISIGFVFAIASMCAAGVVENERKKVSGPPIFQCINGQNYSAADMNIFYQVPQYGLIGISEVFASVGCLEFAYREAPESMHGFVMGLFYLVVSVASLLGAGLYAFSSNVLHWTTSPGKTSTDLGSDLDLYFFLLGGILFVTWLIFIVVSVRYNYRSGNRSSKSKKYSRLTSGERWNTSASQSNSIMTL